ncbi:MAG: 2-oxoacid:acceptor oxidoreductase family protein [Thermofilum sp.]|uniref:pyruvate synthase n=1 Tax=Thermofilum pendens TaxID=2269 RepID=A0A7C4D5E5_THEPE
MDGTFDVVWLGRGGQGGVTAALILAQAAVLRGYYALAIPFFGAERRGAPVFAYNRIAKTRILTRSRVQRGDLLAVLDSTLLRTIKPEGLLKPTGAVVVNSTRLEEELSRVAQEMYCVDALGIAEELNLRLAGIPLVNMPMVGAVARVSGLVSLDELLEATKLQVKAKLSENLKAVEEGWKLVEKCG